MSIDDRILQCNTGGMKHSSSNRKRNFGAHATWSTYSDTKPLSLKDIREAVEKMLEEPEIPMTEAVKYMHIAQEQIEANYDFDPLRYVLTRKEPMYIKPKYAINDTVVNSSRDPQRPNILGEVGRIRQVLKNVAQPSGNPYFYVVEFDKDVQGHDGNGMGKWGHFWAFGEDYITKQTGLVPRKGGNMSVLSTLAKRTFDADTKALVKIGLLDEGLRVADPGLLLEMLVSINYKPLAEEAAKRLAEAEAESKE